MIMPASWSRKGMLHVKHVTRCRAQDLTERGRSYFYFTVNFKAREESN